MLLVTDTACVLLEICSVEWDFFNDFASNYLCRVVLDCILWFLLANVLLRFRVDLLDAVWALNYPVNFIHGWTEQFSHLSEVFLRLTRFFYLRWWILLLLLLIRLLMRHVVHRCYLRSLLYRWRLLLMLESASVLLLLLDVGIGLSRRASLVDWGKSWGEHYSLLKVLFTLLMLLLTIIVLHTTPIRRWSLLVRRILLRWLLRLRWLLLNRRCSGSDMVE